MIFLQSQYHRSRKTREAESRLCVQLAHLYHKGEATAQDTKRAFRYLTTFLNEQSSWMEEVYAAVGALDSGAIPNLV